MPEPTRGERHGDVPFFVRQLEQRRVLSVSPGAVVIAPVVLTGLAEGTALGLEPGESGSADAGTAEPPPAQEPGAAAPTAAAEPEELSDIDSEVSTFVGDPPTTQSTAETGSEELAPVGDEYGEGLSLTVASDQTIDEGALLSITDIGTFTDYGGQFEPEFAAPQGEGGESYTFMIDWGDGTPPDSGMATIDVPGSEESPTMGSFDGSHTYADNGTYTVTVTLSDSLERSVSDTLEVTVNNVRPTLVVPEDQIVNEGSLLSLPDIGQFTDPGFDNPLNIGGETTERFTFAIDWGDGTPLDSGPATIDVPGSEGTPTQGSFDGSHTYADNGAYTVRVTLSDDDGGTVTETFQVTVNNVAPTLVVAPDQVIDEGSLLSITDIGQFTDPGFDNPLNVGGETRERFTFAIDWGDGTPLDSGPAMIDVPGSEGTPTQGSFDGSHTYADNGAYTVRVTLSDDDGGTVTETFQVTVNNVAPTLVVAPDQVIDEGSTLALTDLGVFTDPGYDNPLNIGGEVSEKFTFAIDWGDGTPLDSGPAMIDVPGSEGIPTQGSFDGSHTYADNGVYTVTVTLSDDDGGTVTETFQVTVNNVAPTLIVPEDQIVDEGSLLSLPDIGQFTDPGFDNLLNVGGETRERFTFAINWGDGTPLDSGPATIDVPGGEGTLTQGSFDGSHKYADNGVYTVRVTVSDDDGGTVTETFQVTVNNVAPTLVVPEDQVTDEGSLLSIADIGQFTDPGFDNPLNVGGETRERFTFAIDWGDGTPLDSGPATIDVPGSEGTPTQGSFDGSHTYADNGVYTVRVTISDDDGGTVTETFQVTVNNVAPTLIVPEDQIVDEGSLLSLPDIGQFTDPGFDNPLNVGGETTERFTFAIDWGDGTSADTGMAPIESMGGPGTPTGGSFDGSHIYADNGVYTVRVTVSDDDGGTVIETFQVTVNNVAPTLAVPDDQTVGRNAPLVLPDIGVFTDPGFDNPLNIGGETTERFTFAIDWGDGSPLDSGPGTIDAPGAPNVLTGGSFDGQHVYQDGGIYEVTVTVSDDDGGSATRTFLVYVGPTLSVSGEATVDEGSPLVIVDIGQYVDPTPVEVRPDGSDAEAPFVFSIDWGDGTSSDTGLASLAPGGGEDVAFFGSFSGAHIYADNGLYNVVVTITSPDGRVDTGIVPVTVNNVAPTLIVPGDQTVGQTRPLSFSDIGLFTDPGFDNPLNVGGETAETFTFVVDWGDGTPNSTGPAPVDLPGSPGVLTAGSFAGEHTFFASGEFTVTVTVSDDDGGFDTGTFTVTVGPLVPRNLIFLPPGGGGTGPVERPPVVLAEAQPIVPGQINRSEIVRFRSASVAGAETRLVLREVLPSGVEDKENEEILPNDLLNRLRPFFRRLSDGHYRIYQIRPDGSSRLVVDVIVRQGKTIDIVDEEDGGIDATKSGQDEENDERQDAPNANEEPVELLDEPAVPDALTPRDPDSSDLGAPKPDDFHESDDARWTSAALGVGGGLFVHATPRRRIARLASQAKHRAARSLTKTSRLLRRTRIDPC